MCSPLVLSVRLQKLSLILLSVASSAAIACAQEGVPVAAPHMVPGGPSLTVAPTVSTVPGPAVLSDASAAQVEDPVRTLLDSLGNSEWKSEPSTIVSSSAALPFPYQQSPQLLREYGCRSITYKRFSRTQRAVNVFIYTFPDVEGAFGAYSTMRLGSSNVVVRGNGSSEDDAGICFWKANRFVTITTTAEEDEVSKRFSTYIADQLSSRMPEAGAPLKLLRALPVLDKMAGTERIFMGPVAARKYMAIPFMQTLQIQQSKGAAYADYQFPHPEPDRLKLMVVEYGDPRIASTIYNEYAGEVASIHKSRPLSTTSQLSKAGATYILCMVSRTRVCVIAGAHRKLSPLVLARQLAY